MNIVHIDDSRLALKATSKELRKVFADCEVNSYLIKDFPELIETGNELSNTDIVITDLLMPDISGHDVLKRVQEVNREVFLVVLSSNIQRTEKEIAFRNGAHYFIEKPSTVEKLERMRDAFYARKKRNF